MKALLKRFPQTIQGGVQRNFQESRYGFHSWLQYSQSRDVAYCLPAATLPYQVHLGQHLTSQATPTGKKSYTKLMGLLRRQNQNVMGMQRWSGNEHERMVFSNTSLLEMTSEGHRKKKQQNQQHMKTIAKVLLTAAQNIAQRGHWKPNLSKSNGNFLEILQLLVKHNPLIERKMTERQSAKCTSNTI